MAAPAGGAVACQNMNRAAMNRHSEISRLWFNIIDIIGPINLWLKDIRKLFMEKHWNNKHRFKVAVFTYINGLNPVLLYDWIDLFQNIDKNGEIHIRYLIDLFEEGNRYRREYFSWNVAQGRYQYLDGSTRYYQRIYENV